MPTKKRTEKPPKEWLNSVVAAVFRAQNQDPGPIWAQAMQNGHVPTALKRDGWQEWSAQHIAKNFTALHTLARNAGMDRATSGAFVACMFNKEYAAFTAEGSIESMELVPLPAENRIQLHLTYIHYSNVHREKQSSEQKQVDLCISNDDLAPYRLTEMEGDVIHRQQLSQQIHAGNALLDYDLPTQTLIVSHVVKIKRTSAVLPAEILGAEDFLTTAEQRLLMLTDSEATRQSWLATFVADKTKGWEMTEINDVIASKSMSDTVQKAIDERIVRYRKQWATAARVSAMKNILAAIDQQPMGFFARLFGKKKYVLNIAELKLDKTIERLSQKLPITVQTNTHWLRKMQSIGGDKSRLETKVDVQISLTASAKHRISDPRPGYEGKFISFEVALRSTTLQKVLSVPIE